MGKMPSGPASIGGIEFDAVVSTEEDLSADVPTYATETGFSCGDTITIKPTQLNVVARIASTPVTWAGRHAASDNRCSEVCRELRQLFKRRELFTFYHNGNTWENMAITSLKIPDTKEDGDTVTVTLQLLQVTVTATQMTLVVLSFPRGGTSGTNTGSASTSKNSTKGTVSGNSKSTAKNTVSSSATTTKNNSSILYNLASSVGIFGK